jgi:hypothetical protein
MHDMGAAPLTINPSLHGALSKFVTFKDMDETYSCIVDLICYIAEHSTSGDFVEGFLPLLRKLNNITVSGFDDESSTHTMVNAIWLQLAPKQTPFNCKLRNQWRPFLVACLGELGMKFPRVSIAQHYADAVETPPAPAAAAAPAPAPQVPDAAAMETLMQRLVEQKFADMAAKGDSVKGSGCELPLTQYPEFVRPFLATRPAELKMTPFNFFFAPFYAHSESLFGPDGNDTCHNKALNDFLKNKSKMVVAFDPRVNPASAITWFHSLLAAKAGLQKSVVVLLLIQSNLIGTSIARGFDAFLSNPAVLAVGPDTKLAWLLASFQEYLSQPQFKDAAQTSYEKTTFNPGEPVAHFFSRLQEAYYACFFVPPSVDMMSNELLPKFKLKIGEQMLHQLSTRVFASDWYSYQKLTAIISELGDGVKFPVGKAHGLQTGFSTPQTSQGRSGSKEAVTSIDGMTRQPHPNCQCKTCMTYNIAVQQAKGACSLCLQFGHKMWSCPNGMTCREARCTRCDWIKTSHPNYVRDHPTPGVCQATVYPCMVFGCGSKDHATAQCPDLHKGKGEASGNKRGRYSS